MARFKEIALAFPRGAHQEVFVEGVLRYARENDCHWTYISAPESLSLSIEDLVGWPGDGILAALQTPAQLRLAQRLAIPLVNVSSAIPNPPVPSCLVDNHAIGRIAADHLAGRGHQVYAFYGLKNVEFSKQRYAAFDERLREKGLPTKSFLVEATFASRRNGWLDQYRALSQWLKSLAKPFALFAVSDYRARQVLDACRSVDLRVPDDAAVLGVDNELVICEHSHPTLSSVARNDGLEGYSAAALLDRLIRGKSVKPMIQTIPPVQVIQRESTASFAVSDRRLKDALTFMHQNLDAPISVESISRHAVVSRRWLEYAFREALGETPFQYLRRQRLAHAKQLLVNEPDVKLLSVAQRCGFSSAKQLTVAFQQEFGMTPSEYRRGGRANGRGGI